jgi:prophage antirepressor-like protein
MGKQLGLFDAPPAAPAPPASNPTTSRAAARAIEPVAATFRRRVLDVLRSRGAHGATDQEMQDALGMNPSNQCPRRQELQKMGLARDSGNTRATRSGRKAIVWTAIGADAPPEA